MVLPAQVHLPTHVHHTKAFNQAVVFNKLLYETNKKKKKKREGVAWELRAIIRSQRIAP